MTEDNRADKAPTHIAWHVREAGEQSHWDRLGAAWMHSDGEGMSVRLNALPVDGQIVIRTRKDKHPQEAA